MSKIFSKYKKEEEKVLRNISEELSFKKYSKKDLEEIFSKMSKELSEEEKGVAIAAPQVGINLRIFVVAGKVFDTNQEEENKKKNKDEIFINPQITKKSKKKYFLEEGCLSVVGMYGEVLRYKNLTIKYFDINGNEKKRGAGGLLAQIFQHEIDHLDGILFTDKAENLRKLEEENL